MNRKRKVDDLIPAHGFQCACGCGLVLSRKDLADAIRLADRFDGNPRTYGVTYTKFQAPRDMGESKQEPNETRACPECKTEIVSLPVFAAKMLDERRAPWPKCDECRNPKAGRSPREYWE